MSGRALIRISFGKPLTFTTQSHQGRWWVAAGDKVCDDYELDIRY